MHRLRIIGLGFFLLFVMGVRPGRALAAAEQQTQRTVEFVYRPKDDPAWRKDMEVHSVNLAGSFNDWSRTDMPMTDRNDGTYVKDVTLDEGLHHYKFILNGDTWMSDPKADPSLRADDGHEGFNSGVFVGEQGKDYGAAPSNDVNLAAVRHYPDRVSYFNVISSDAAEVKLR